MTKPWIDPRLNLHDANIDLLPGIRIRNPIVPVPDACNHAVNRIVSAYPNQQYSLMLSGGIDSQAMLIAWVNNGVPFKAYHVHYPGFNEHDREVFQLANTLGVEISIVEFDVLSFYYTEYLSYVDAYRCGSPQICVHMAFASMIPGIKIFSGTPAVRDSLMLDNTIYGLARYAEFSGDSVVPLFFSSTPEIITSFYNAFEEFNIAGDFYQTKVKMLNAHGFDVVPQPQKITGFEKIKMYFDLMDISISDSDRARYIKKFGSNRNFDHLLRHPNLERLNNHYRAAVIIEPC